MPEQAAPTFPQGSAIEVTIRSLQDRIRDLEGPTFPNVYRGANRTEILDEGHLILFATGVELAGHAAGCWSSYRIQHAEDAA